MSIANDPIPLMRQLARMAKIPEGLCRRMVLILDVDDIPRLYTEGFLAVESQETLVTTELITTDEPYVFDTTTMQNEVWRTKTAPPRKAPEPPRS